MQSERYGLSIEFHSPLSEDISREDHVTENAFTFAIDRDLGAVKAVFAEMVDNPPPTFCETSDTCEYVTTRDIGSESDPVIDTGCNPAGRNHTAPIPVTRAVNPAQATRAPAGPVPRREKRGPAASRRVSHGEPRARRWGGRGISQSRLTKPDRSSCRVLVGPTPGQWSVFPDRYERPSRWDRRSAGTPAQAPRYSPPPGSAAGEVRRHPERRTGEQRIDQGWRKRGGRRGRDNEFLPMGGDRVWAADRAWNHAADVHGGGCCVSWGGVPSDV